MQNVTAVREVICKDIDVSCPYYNLGIGPRSLSLFTRPLPTVLQFGNTPKKFVFVYQTTSYCFCVRLTDNMMCNLAIELAMASTASTVDLERCTLK